MLVLRYVFLFDALIRPAIHHGSHQFPFPEVVRSGTEMTSRSRCRRGRLSTGNEVAGRQDPAAGTPLRRPGLRRIRNPVRPESHGLVFDKLDRVHFGISGPCVTRRLIYGSIATNNFLIRCGRVESMFRAALGRNVRGRRLVLNVLYGQDPARTDQSEIKECTHWSACRPRRAGINRRI